MTAVAYAVAPQIEPDPNWINLCQRGRDAEAKGTSALWESGDIALEVETTYGDQSLQHYASEINVDYRTVARRRWTAKSFSGERFYLRSVYAMLRWSHFEAVAGVKEEYKLLAYLDEAQHSTDRNRPLNVQEFRLFVRGNGHLPRGKCRWLRIYCDKDLDTIPLAKCATCDEHEEKI